MLQCSLKLWNCCVCKIKVSFGFPQCLLAKGRRKPPLKTSADVNKVAGANKSGVDLALAVVLI